MEGSWRVRDTDENRLFRHMVGLSCDAYVEDRKACYIHSDRDSENHEAVSKAKRIFIARVILTDEAEETRGL